MEFIERVESTESQDRKRNRGLNLESQKGMFEEEDQYKADQQL